MLVTFNPSLTNTKSLRSNCCGGKNVAFGKYEVIPEKLIECPGNVIKFCNAIVARQVVDSPAVREKIARARTLTSDKGIHAYLKDAEELLAEG